MIIEGHFTIDYKFGKHAFIPSYNSYQLSYRCKLILSISIHEKLEPIIDLDDLEVLTQYLNVWIVLQESHSYSHREFVYCLELRYDL